MYFYFYFWPLITVAEIPKQTPYNFSVTQQLFLSSKPGLPVVEQQEEYKTDHVKISKVIQSMQGSHGIVITDDHAWAITRLTNWEYDIS